MSQTQSERRQVENELYFRQQNERIQKGFDNLLQLAKEDNQDGHILDSDLPLLFFCECSDENCLQRVPVELSVYNLLHKERDNFIIVTGHEVHNIETIVKKTDSYTVVKKRVSTKDIEPKLNKTDIDNS